MRSDNAFKRSNRRAPSTTLAPRSASRSAVASPIPLLAPVIAMTLSLIPGMKLSSLEPIAAVGYPPTHQENRDSRPQRPPEWQNEISYQPQGHESEPKDFSFHYLSLQERPPDPA